MSDEAIQHSVLPIPGRRHVGSTTVVTPVIPLGRPRVRRGKDLTVAGASFGYGGVVRFRLDRRGGPTLGAAYMSTASAASKAPQIFRRARAR
jgi:hypothetical protein